MLNDISVRLGDFIGQRDLLKRPSIQLQLFKATTALLKRLCVATINGLFVCSILWIDVHVHVHVHVAVQCEATTVLYVLTAVSDSPWKA